MAQQSKETLIKRYESCAETYKKKGDREYAYAKNGLGDEHYGKAKEAYKRSKRNQNKADTLEPVQYLFAHVVLASFLSCFVKSPCNMIVWRRQFLCI